METLKNESVKEALKKCNPQRAIIALAEITDQFDTGIQNAQAIADQAIKNAAAAATVANEAKQEAAQATINVGEAFDNTRVTPNSSTVVVEFDRINGNEQNVALPVVNTTNAGILNANDYKFFQEYDARIRAVEGVSKIYLVELPSDNPSSQQITLAYTSQWPDAPNPPLEGTVVVDPARNNLSYRWNTQSNTWYKISEVAIQQFTNTTLGTIKGSTQDGEVQANADGTGSVTGWDVVKGNITTLEENAIANIRGIGNSEGMNLELINQNNLTKNTVALPVANSTNGGIVGPNVINKVNSLGAPIPFLDIVINGPTVVTPTGNSANTYQVKTLTKRIATGLTRYRDIFWFISGTALIYTEAPANPGSDNYNIGNVQLATVMSSVQNAINNWNAHWYGGSELYMRFKVYVGNYNGSAFELRYKDTQFADGDPWLSTVFIKITSSGIELMETVRNPLLEPSSAVDVSKNATNWVLYLDYLGTSAP